MKRGLLLAVLVAAGCQTATQSKSGLPADSNDRLSHVWRSKQDRLGDYDYLYVADVQTDISPHDRRAGPVGSAQLMLKQYLVGAMIRSDVFRHVTGTPPAADSNAKILRLECMIEQVKRGSQPLRYWVGMGSGLPKLHVRTQFVDQATGQVVCEVAKGTHGFSGREFFFGALMTDSDVLEDGIRSYARHLGEYVQKTAGEP